MAGEGPGRGTGPRAGRGAAQAKPGRGDAPHAPRPGSLYRPRHLPPGPAAARHPHGRGTHRSRDSGAPAPPHSPSPPAGRPGRGPRLCGARRAALTSGGVREPGRGARLGPFALLSSRLRRFATKWRTGSRAHVAAFPLPRPLAARQQGGAAGARVGGASAEPPVPLARRSANQSAGPRATCPISAARPLGDIPPSSPRPSRPSARSQRRAPIGRERTEFFLPLWPIRAGTAVDAPHAH